MARKLPRDVRLAIEDAIKVLRMENCGVAEEHKKAMRLYLETWGAARLERVLSWDDGEIRSTDLWRRA